MTDHLDPDTPDPDTPDRDTVDPDAAVTPAQLAELRAELADEPVDIDPGLREQHVLAALDASVPEEDVVIELGGARQGRTTGAPPSARGRSWRALLVAASVLAVAGLGALALNATGSSVDMATSGGDADSSSMSGDEESTADALDPLQESADGSESAPAAPSTSASGGASDSSASLPDLGRYPDVASLLAARPAAVLDAPEEGADSDPITRRGLPEGSAGCLYQEALAGSTLLGISTVRGIDVIVVDRGGVVVVLDLLDCTQLVD